MHEDNLVFENNKWRPDPPDRNELELEAQLKSTGANIHRIRGSIFAILTGFELGEEKGWDKESRDLYDKAVNEFYKRLSSGV